MSMMVNPYVFASGDVTQWRLLFPDGSPDGTGRVQLSEVEMFDSDVSTTDLCTGGAATESGHDSSQTPDLAYDNNTATSWRSNTGAGCWLGYTFGAAQSVASFSARTVDGQLFFQPISITLQRLDGSWQDVEIFASPLPWGTVEATLRFFSDGTISANGVLVDDYRLLASDCHPNITISSDGVTATKASGGIAWRTGRSVNSHTSGKYYYEWVPVEFSGSFTAAGFATSASTLANYPGSESTSLGLVTNGAVFRNGGSTATLPAFAEGDVISMAIDLDNDTFWCRRNGGNWNNSGTADPATNTGGLALNAGMTTGSPAIFAAVGVQLSPTDQVTVNLGGSAFTYGVPSGFTAWG